MNILVTGAFGFIGSNLVPKLLKAGHSVVGIDNLFNPSLNPPDRIKAEAGKDWEKFKFYKIDIRKNEDIKNILIYDKPDAIVHLAAVGSVPRSFRDPLHTVSANEAGFVSILDIANHPGIQCKRVVFASSSSVYGNHPDTIRKEGYEGIPLSPYALSKKMNESFARIWAPLFGINFVGLRFFNVYGPGQRPDSAYSAVIPRFINDEIPEIYGEGNTVRDFTFVDDVCEAIIKSIELTEKRSAILNVGTGNGTDLNKLATLVGRVPVKKPVRPGDIEKSIADTTKAKEILFWEAKTSIEDGVEITKKYYGALKVKYDKTKA